MEIKINVDETKFKDVIENELNAFSKEELHEIIRECIVEALHNDNILKCLFIKPEKDYFGNYKFENPSEVMIEAAKNIDLSPAYEEVQNMMITELKENYSKLLQNIMMKTMVDGLCNDWNFRTNLESAIHEVMMARSNQNGY